MTSTSTAWPNPATRLLEFGDLGSEVGVLLLHLLDLHPPEGHQAMVGSVCMWFCCAFWGVGRVSQWVWRLFDHDSVVRVSKVVAYEICRMTSSPLAYPDARDFSFIFQTISGNLSTFQKQAQSAWPCNMSRCFTRSFFSLQNADALQWNSGEFEWRLAGGVWKTFDSRPVLNKLIHHVLLVDAQASTSRIDLFGWWSPQQEDKQPQKPNNNFFHSDYLTETILEISFIEEPCQKMNW